MVLVLKKRWVVDNLMELAGAGLSQPVLRRCFEQVVDTLASQVLAGQYDAPAPESQLQPGVAAPIAPEVLPAPPLSGDRSSQGILGTLPSLATSIDRYLGVKRHEVRPQHLSGLSHILWRFCQKVNRERGGDFRSNHLTRLDVSGYRDQLLESGRCVTTANQHVVLIVAFLRWAQREGLADDTMHLDGLTLKQTSVQSTQRAAFSVEEVQHIFRPAFFEATRNKPPSYRWLPLIMAYSGARPEEVAQLLGTDVREENGILVFDFTSIEEGQRRKNESSRRMVPVHSRLLDFGLFSQAFGPGVRNLPLFPELGNGGRNGRRAEAPSRWFNRKWLRDSCGIRDTRKVLYSLRHTVATVLKHKGVEESLISELLGHSNPSLTTGRYGKAYPLTNLTVAVEMIDYR